VERKVTQIEFLNKFLLLKRNRKSSLKPRLSAWELIYEFNAVLSRGKEIQTAVHRKVFRRGRDLIIAFGCRFQRALGNYVPKLWRRIK